MSTYFLAPDGSGDLTLWRDVPDRPDYPEALVRQFEVGPDVWSLIVAGLAVADVLADWDTWNVFHGSYRTAARDLREAIEARAARSVS